MKVGQGFDVHRFAAGTEIILGGVKIPHTQGIEAHSDGDVLLHAICDALLGAAGLGDIGDHFPDSDAAHKNRDSREFLRAVYHEVCAQNMKIANIDATVILQQPKIKKYVAAMCANIAHDLNIESGLVNVKATTTENLGFPGRGEGIAALAIVLLR